MFMKYVEVIIFIFLVIFISVSCKKEQEVVTTPITETPNVLKDYDGNIYRTIQIGNQVWMAENFRGEHYIDGQSLPNCFYDNDSTNLTIYGRLYKWEGVVSSAGNTKKILPDGWRIPSLSDWQQLIAFLGGDSLAGGKMKSTGTQYWLAPNEGASNESDFSAVPAGFFRVDGVFMTLGEYACFMTSANINNYYTKVINLSKNSATAMIKEYLKQDAISIRCIRE